MQIIGLVPAAGQASRLGRLPCSKEILPVYSSLGAPENGAPRVVSEYLLRAYGRAGISEVFFILRQGKWDIPAYFGSGRELGMRIGYLVTPWSWGIPFTLETAYPFLGDRCVALGFPDMYIQPADSFVHMREKLQTSGADLVLGLFPIEKTHKWDMVEFDSDQRIRDIVIKQERPDLRYGWALALWTPRFSEYLHARVEAILASAGDGTIALADGGRRELYPGDIIRSAIRDNLRLEYVLFAGGRCVDIGTPDEVCSL